MTPSSTNDMNILSGDSVAVPFTLNDLVLGAVNADSTPTGVLYVNGSASGIAVVVTNPVLGQYIATFTITGSVGDNFFLVMTSLVDSKTYREAFGPWKLDAIRLSDPMGNDPDTYTDGTLGALIGKLDVGAPDDPVIVIPDPAQDPQVCRLYGYVRTEEGRPAANVAITAELIPTATAAKIPGYLISRKKVTFSTNSEGRVIDAFGNLFVELVRTDSIVPNATEWKYQITCSEAKLSAQTVLEEDRFDIATLIDS